MFQLLQLHSSVNHNGYFAFQNVNKLIFRCWNAEEEIQLGTIVDGHGVPLVAFQNVSKSWNADEDN